MKGCMNMVKFITGAKGSGKTKWLIDSANQEYKSGNGNIAFIDTDDDHIFSLDFNVRLINVTEYKVRSLPALYGFVCGMLAMDYDLEKIYVDSVYKLIKFEDEDLDRIYKDLNEIAEANNADIYINIDKLTSEMPESLRAYCEEASL